MSSPVSRSRRRGLPAGLHLVATPIGNLRDITLRALETLAAADVIACEDTRVTRRLLDHYGIATPLTPYHEHNAAAARPKLLARLAAGEAIALVSDAGTPLISDPGFKLVRAACEAGHAVDAAPGASAALAALAVAGLPTDRFFFEGFLPPKDGARRTRIAELSRIPATLIFYESGPRVGRTLAALAEGLGAAPGRGLPRAHQAARGGAPRRSRRAGARPTQSDAEIRGEFTIVVAPPAADAGTVDADEIDALLRRALQACLGEGRRQRRGGRNRPAAPRNLSARAGAQRTMTMARRRKPRTPRPSRGPSASPRISPGCRRKAAPPPISSPKAIASWRGASKPRSARSISWRAAATCWCSSRSRRATRSTMPRIAVLPRQQQRIAAAAGAWLAAHPEDVESDIRFDAVLVAPGSIPRHIPAAFETE